MAEKKIIAIGCDHAGYRMKSQINAFLKEQGYQIKDFGCPSEDSVDYPDFAHPVADAVSKGEYKSGILLCGSGNGINMSANKHNNIRAALCWKKDIAILARKHNDANILSLPAKFIDAEEAKEIVFSFLTTGFDGGRHQRRIEKINKFFSVLFFLAGLWVSFAGQPDSTALKFSGVISKENLRNYVYKLASEEFEGRETSKKGQKKAARYIAGCFKNMGIRPPGDTSYFQEFPLNVSYHDFSTLSIGGKEFNFLSDYYYLPGFPDTLIKTGGLYFAGYGINEKKQDDYKKGDVKGKTVMIINGEPFDKKKNIFTLSGNSAPSPWTTNRYQKTTIARQKGAVAMLMVVDSIEKSINRMRHFINSPMYSLEGASDSRPWKMPVFYISREMAGKIFSANKLDFNENLKKIGQKGNIKPVTIKTDIFIEIMRKKEKATAENVLGYIEGTDKKEEVIIVSAHYDHLGKDGDEIYFGADDDASGTAAVLELAGAFARASENGVKPRRSILFMPVAGEEKGLLGSEYYTTHPVFPLANTVADLNIDMIGRIDTLHRKNPYYTYIIGSDKISTDLHKINEDANSKYTQLQLDYSYNSPADPNRFYYRSDHYNFAKNNIPIIFYFTGVHEDYHRPTDTPEKINYDKMERITRLVFFTLWELANREERIKADVGNIFEIR